ncbi:MAG: hypothetical protein DRP91_06945 [Candidatus Neomarinimicrobiota bacterium]|nr:MAG: hypothetical protein DRP91_06945 [Candidatus Neomarinimicrobiota bacterium]
MRRGFLEGVVLLFVLSFGACTSVSSLKEIGQSKEKASVESILQAMSLREKVGQLILMTFSTDFVNEDDSVWQMVEKDIRTNNVFGYHIWSGNVHGARYYIDKMQEMAKIPLVFVADFERGVGLQYRGAVEFPPNMAITATGNPAYAYLVGKAMAREARSLGFNMTFAPVVDVNINPDNPIINTRSFSEDPKVVARYAIQFMKGCHEVGIGCVAKHFPGHGDTETDSHLNLPVINASADRLEKVELYPFREMIKNNVDAIMSAHIYVPAIEEEERIPATLSRCILDSLLRKQMGFSGVIFTDAMGMGGIVKNFTPEFAFVNAIKAGCDVIINTNWPADSAIAWILRAVKRGEIKEERIDESVERILKLKQKLGLFSRFRKDDDEAYTKTIGKRDFRKLAKEISEKAITLVKDDKGLIPVKESNFRNVYVVNLYDVKTGISKNSFSRGILERVENAFSYTFDISDSLCEFEGFLGRSNIGCEDLVIFGVFCRCGAYKGHVDIPENLKNMVRETLARCKNVIVYSFGNPYVIRNFSDVSTYLCGFAWQDYAQSSAVEALFGEIEISGKMPVTVPGVLGRGEGLCRSQISAKSISAQKKEEVSTLRIGYPHEAGVNVAELKNLERIIKEGLADSAYPGATFIAGRNGIIFYKGAFGKLSYDKSAPATRLNTIYDLASLTKPIATTSAVMILYDRGMLKLDDRVCKYIPEFSSNNKKSITIRHLLTHSSGLPGWIKLWEKGGTPAEMLSYLYRIKPVAEPGQRTIYSCLGFIVLGKVVEKITGENLNDFLRDELFGPLSMNRTFFNPPDSLRNQIAPTELDPERGGVVQGKVHDENAYYLGGISGNAGLFSTASDLAIFAQMLLNKGSYGSRSFFKEETVELFLSPQNLPPGSKRTLGWGTIKVDSRKVVAHTGFTGTAIWLIPDENLFAIFLTNRVHPTRENVKIEAVRKKLLASLIRLTQW